MTDFLPYSRKSNIKKSDKTSTPNTGRYGDVTAPSLSKPKAKANWNRSIETKSGGAKASKDTYVSGLINDTSIETAVKRHRQKKVATKDYTSGMGKGRAKGKGRNAGR